MTNNINTENKSNSDKLTDYIDDGLDDNEEVDVELTKIEIQGKQGNPSTYKYYHHMWSDPTKVDTDGDGLIDGQKDENGELLETAPLERGIADGIVGELTIVSATGGTGHAFLIYRSYINSYLDFSEFTCGYSKNDFVKESPQIYQISSMEYVSIGNAGKGITSGTPQIFETEHWGIDGDNAGVYYNRELAYEMSTYKEKFDPQNTSAYKKIYKENSSLTLPVTQEQLDRAIETCNRLNYYHIIENNCVVVASTAWNEAFSNDADCHLPVVIKPKTLRDAIDDYDQSEEFDIYRKVFGIDL